jgi:hypothetical protein
LIFSVNSASSRSFSFFKSNTLSSSS